MKLCEHFLGFGEDRSTYPQITIGDWKTPYAQKRWPWQELIAEYLLCRNHASSSYWDQSFVNIFVYFSQESREWVAIHLLHASIALVSRLTTCSMDFGFRTCCLVLRESCIPVDDLVVQRYSNYAVHWRITRKWRVSAPLISRWNFLEITSSIRRDIEREQRKDRQMMIIGNIECSDLDWLGLEFHQSHTSTVTRVNAQSLRDMVTPFWAR